MPILLKSMGWTQLVGGLVVPRVHHFLSGSFLGWPSQQKPRWFALAQQKCQSLDTACCGSNFCVNSSGETRTLAWNLAGFIRKSSWVSILVSRNVLRSRKPKGEMSFSDMHSKHVKTSHPSNRSSRNWRSRLDGFLPFLMHRQSISQYQSYSTITLWVSTINGHVQHAEYKYYRLVCLG